MGKKIVIIITVCIVLLASGCKGDSSSGQSAEVSASETVQTGTSEAAIRAFLHSAPGTYGWVDSDGWGLDFFEDGRLHIQGDEGEATMWEGTWLLKGAMLTMKCADLELDSTIQVVMDGDTLVLDGERFSRYTP